MYENLIEILLYIMFSVIAARVHLALPLHRCICLEIGKFSDPYSFLISSIKILLQITSTIGHHKYTVSFFDLC